MKYHGWEFNGASKKPNEEISKGIFLIHSCPINLLMGKYLNFKKLKGGNENDED